MWRRVAQALQDHYFIVLPDLRGYGDSSKASGSPTTAATASAQWRRTSSASWTPWNGIRSICAATTVAAGWRTGSPWTSPGGWTSYASSMTYLLARAVEAGALSADAEVRVRKVRELVPSEAIAANEAG